MQVRHKTASAQCPKSQLRRPCALVTLLFKLPPELRLHIYDYLTPAESPLLVPRSSHWHWALGTPEKSDRRAFRWLGISRDVFLEAGPAFYGQALYFWIDARANGQGRTLDDALKQHIKLAHERDVKWIMDVVRSSMLKKLMLEVHMASSGENLQSVLLRFAEMASAQLNRYNALEEIYISLRPHYNNSYHKGLLKSFTFSDLQEKIIEASWPTWRMCRVVRQVMQEKIIKNSWPIRRMCRAVRQVKLALPIGCKVHWYLPGAEMAKVSCRRRGDGQSERSQGVLDSEVMVMDFMEDLWRFVCERSETELDDLLSEQDLTQKSLGQPDKMISH